MNKTFQYLSASNTFLRNLVKRNLFLTESSFHLYVVKLLNKGGIYGVYTSKVIDRHNRLYKSYKSIVTIPVSGI